jgi:deoxyribodipyrimidine photo-lyase
MQRAVRCNNAEFNPQGAFVLYWMTAYRRRGYNFALQRAAFWASELRKPLLILEALASGYPWASPRFDDFIRDGMYDNLRTFAGSAASYHPFVEGHQGQGKGLVHSLASQACVVVTDDFPAFEIPRWIESVASRSPVLVEKVDSNGLFPMRSTDRVFLTAHSFRRFLEKQLPQEFPAADPLADLDLPALTIPDILKKRWPTAAALKPPAGRKIVGGPSAAHRQFKEFLASDQQASGMSPYIHFGHVSSHELYSAARHKPRFLDQLVTWRELGFNMCALVSNYDRYESLPAWAQRTLAKHEKDRREFVYSLDEFDRAATHDPIWNAAQKQLVEEGSIHNTLRMLWGKKILEWSATPREALDIMIELNNKYALDGRDPNSYNGIFWILGRYDRPWGPERPVFGLIRYMSSINTARKMKKAGTPVEISPH